MPPAIKKPINEEDVEQAIREILRVATLWSANKRAGVSPSAMAYHENFLRIVCKAALQHWNKLPLKRPSKSKAVLHRSDFASYSVLTHIMDALDQYRRRAMATKKGPTERDRTYLIQLIHAATPVLGRGEEVDFAGEIERVLKRFEKETDKVKKLDRNLRRTAGTIVHALGGTSSTKLFLVRDVVEQEGPKDLEGSPFRPLVARRRLEERENGRYVGYESIREFALNLLGLSRISPSCDESVKDENTPIDNTIDPALPDYLRALVEKARQDAQAVARHLSKYPSSRGLPLIGDNDMASRVHQAPKRNRAAPSRKNRKG